MPRSLLESTVGTSQDDPSTLFNLILLGTDTWIEDNAKLNGYERGESLNGIFRCLNGAEFCDKHIVSGPRTDGANTDIKALEGLFMVLKAISEGKTKIKVAGHSRGGIESLLVANALEKIISFLKAANKDSFKDIFIKKGKGAKEAQKKRDKLTEDLKKLKIGYLETNLIQMLFNGKDNTIIFQSQQIKEDSKDHRKLNTVTKEHPINIDQLLDKVNQNELSCELFLIDPVPGQEYTSNWYRPEFFTIPQCVKKAKYIYMNGERTQYFEPVVLQDDPKHCELEITAVPGHHGSASGWLNEQGVPESKKIGDDSHLFTVVATATKAKDKKTVEEKAKDSASSSSSSATEEATVVKNRKGKNTRHVQKLVVTKMIEFFGKDAFTQPTESDLKRISPKEVSLITRTIHKCLRPTQTLVEYKLELYAKIAEYMPEYVKFHDTAYSSIFWKEHRGTLVCVFDEKKGPVFSCVPFNSHHRLHDPVVPGFVNKEHMHLSSSRLIRKYHLKEGDSPIDSVMKLYEVFADPNSKVNKRKIETLYSSDASANDYVALFELLIGGFIATRVQMIIEQEKNKEVHLHDIKNIIAAIGKLKEKMLAHEKANKTTVIVSNKLEKTWNDIVNNIAISSKINATCFKLKQLFDDKINQLGDKERKSDKNSPEKTAASSEMLIQMLEEMEKMVFGLYSLQEIGLISEESCKKYTQICDPLINCIKLAIVQDQHLTLINKALNEYEQNVRTRELGVQARHDQLMSTVVEEKERLKADIARLTESYNKLSIDTAELSAALKDKEQTTAELQEKNARIQQQLLERNEALKAESEKLKKDERQVEERRRQLKGQENLLKENEKSLEEGRQDCLRRESLLAELRQQLTEREATSARKEAELTAREVETASKERSLTTRELQSAARETRLATREAQSVTRETELATREAQTEAKETDLTARETRSVARESELAAREAQSGLKEAELAARELRSVKRESELTSFELRSALREASLSAREARSATRETELIERDKRAAAREAELSAKEAQSVTRESELNAREAQSAKREEELTTREAKSVTKEAELVAKERQSELKEQELSAREALSVSKEAALTTREALTVTKEAELTAREEHSVAREAGLTEREALSTERETTLAEREEQFTVRTAELTEREQQSTAREAELIEREEHSAAREAELAARQVEIAKKEAQLVQEDARLTTGQVELTELNNKYTEKLSQLAADKAAFETERCRFKADKLAIEARLAAIQSAHSDKQKALDAREQALLAKEQAYQQNDKKLADEKAKLAAEQTALKAAQEIYIRDNSKLAADQAKLVVDQAAIGALQGQYNQDKAKLAEDQNKLLAESLALKFEQDAVVVGKENSTQEPVKVAAEVEATAPVVTTKKPRVKRNQDKTRPPSPPVVHPTVKLPPAEAKPDSNTQQEPADLRHPLIIDLDEQLMRLAKQGTVAKDKQPEAAFVMALADLRCQLKADIDNQVKHGRKDIANSAAGKLAIQTTQMLIKLQTPSIDKIQVLREYEEECKQVSGWKKFLKAITCVIFAAVGYLFGSYIGLTASNGALQAPRGQSIVTKALCTIGAAGASIASSLVGNMLFFGRSKLQSQAIHAMNTGVEAYSPRKQ